MKKISIYLVENDLFARTAYRYSLGNTGEVEIAGEFDNAEDCIKALEKNPVRIVLMDLVLPFMNGIKATKIITENFPNTKVIMLTSHQSDEKVIASLYSGASGYVIKDLDTENLIKVIKAVNIGAIWLAPQILNIAKEVLPKPDSTDLDNLYSNKEIKSLLTRREYQVLKLLTEGKSNVEIAKIMTVSINTAKAHVGSILNKLSVSDRVQAAVLAVKSKIV